MGSEKLAKRFEKCRKQGRPAFVAYITSGDPDYKTSLEIVDELVSAGIDVLELGVPFSDPLADGEANQLAAGRALDAGMNALKVLDQAKEIRARHPDLPLVLFTYLNPVAYVEGVSFGEYCGKAAESGVDAILPLDLPPDEETGYREAIDSSGLKLVTLVAPTSSEERISLLAKSATGFVYYVSREGVTGEGDDFASDFSGTISRIHGSTDLPVVVGFGISSPEHVKNAASTGVDGVVVGSAIVRKIQAISKGELELPQLGEFVRSLTEAVSS